MPAVRQEFRTIFAIVAAAGIILTIALLIGRAAHEETLGRALAQTEAHDHREKAPGR